MVPASKKACTSPAATQTDGPSGSACARGSPRSSRPKLGRPLTGVGRCGAPGGGRPCVVAAILFLAAHARAGTLDFAAAPQGLLRYAQHLALLQAPPVLSNLRCDASQPLCRSLSQERVIERGGVRVGLLAVLREDLERRVGPGHLPGAVLPTS